MIIPLPFIVSLLFTISYATDFDYKIDLTRCQGPDADTTCYIRKSCLTSSNDASKAVDSKELVQFKEDVEKLKDVENGKGCDVVLQIKAISKSKFLVLIELKKDQVDFDPTKGIVIKQLNINQVECKEGGVTGANSDVTVVPKGVKPTVFDATRMFCSFTMTRNDATKKLADVFEFESVNEEDDTYPSLIYYESTTEIMLTHYIAREKLWSPLFRGCDKEPITSDKEDKAYQLVEIDTAQKELKCPGNSKILLKSKGLDAIEVENVICKNFKLFWNDEKDKASPSDVELYCIKKTYCSDCTDIDVFKSEECPNCKPFTPIADGQCKTLTCKTDEGEKFTTDGVNSVVVGSKGIFCRKKSDGESEWAIHVDDSYPAVTKASCFVFKGCTPLTMFDCPEGVECKAEPTFDQPNSNYSCPDPDAVLHQDKEKVSLSCAENKWSGIDTSKSLYCAIEEKKGTAAKEDPNTGGGGLIAGVVIGIIVILGLIAGGAFYFLVYKKKKDAKKTTKKEEGTSKKSSKKSGGVGSSDEGTAKKDKDTKKESASEPNKESEKPATGAEPPKEPAKDGKEPPKDGKEPPKDGKDAAPAGAPSPAPPTTPATGTAPGTPAEAAAPAPIPPDATAV